MSRWVKIVLMSGLVLVLFLALPLVFPTLLNPIAEDLLLGILSRFDVKIPKQSLSVEIKSPGFLDHTLVVRVKDAEIHLPQGEVNVKTLSTRVAWSWTDGLAWQKLNGVIRSVDLKIESSSQSSEGGSFEMIWPKSGELGIQSLAVAYGDKTVEGSAQLEFESSQGFTLGAHLTLTSSEYRPRLAVSYRGNLKSPENLFAQLRAKSISATARGDANGFQVNFSSPWAEGRLEGKNFSHVQGTITAKGNKVELERCDLVAEPRFCLLSLEQGARLRVTVAQQEDDIVVSVDPLSVPKWITKHPDSFRVVVGEQKVALQGFTAPIELHLDALLDRFSIARQYIPRPLNALDGTLNLDLSTPFFWSSPDGPKGKFALTTDLKSPSQVLNARLFVRADSSGWEFELVPSNIQLVAPPVSVIRSSRFTPESRLSFKKQEKKGDSISPNWTLNATEGYPLSVVLPERNETVSFRGKLTGPDLSGWLAAKPVNIDIVGRSARIRKFRVSPLETGEWEIDGAISTDVAGYRVFMNLGGTSKSLQFSFDSKPPLAENQIIDLLLFGKLSNQLSQSESSMSRDFQTAAVEGAVNFMSLYFLSQTPLKGLRYNPLSKQLSISVEVGERNLLTLETETQGQAGTSLEWQRRLGGNWWFTTRVYSEDGIAPSEGQTFLEWIRQY